MRRLAEAIGAYAGLDPPPWLLEARVRERADELGLDEGAYLELVAGTSDEGVRERSYLTERLRVGETRFFRHRAQIEALRARVLPSLFARNERPVRAWSAGCATGEEAFTLALLLHEAAPRESWEVLGTDLSGPAIAGAEAARWPIARLQEIPDTLRHHFISDGDSLVARPTLRARVRFAQQNLLDARPARGVDLVLCRNVLIYFDAERRAQVIARLSDALRAGGWLCLGYSESLRNHEEARLEPVRVNDTVIYRRREITDKVSLPPDADRPAPPPSLPTRDEPKAGEPPTLKLRGEYPEGARLQSELRPFLAVPAIIDLDGADFLGEEAARVLKRALQAAPALTLRATRAPILRWMAKHGLAK